MRCGEPWKCSRSFLVGHLLSACGALRQGTRSIGSSSSMVLARHDIGEGELLLAIDAMSVGGLKGMGRS